MHIPFFSYHSHGYVYKRCKPIDHTELFKDDASVVLIEGIGGSGKSTLVRKIAKDWATPTPPKEQYFPHRFALLIVIEGRKLGELGFEACLNDLIGVKSEEKQMIV